jgi:hypothetical protein
LLQRDFRRHGLTCARCPSSLRFFSKKQLNTIQKNSISQNSFLSFIFSTAYLVFQWTRGYVDITLYPFSISKQTGHCSGSCFGWSNHAQVPVLIAKIPWNHPIIAFPLSGNSPRTRRCPRSERQNANIADSCFGIFLLNK